MIETKDYDDNIQLSDENQSKINRAKEFFNEMRASGYDVHFRPQISSITIKTIIEDSIY